MIQKILHTLVIATSLILTGCGNNATRSYSPEADIAAMSADRESCYIDYRSRVLNSFHDYVSCKEDKSMVYARRNISNENIDLFELMSNYRKMMAKAVDAGKITEEEYNYLVSKNNSETKTELEKRYATQAARDAARSAMFSTLISNTNSFTSSSSTAPTSVSVEPFRCTAMPFTNMIRCW